MRRLLMIACALSLAACSDNQSSTDFDLGADFTLGPQFTHIGPTANVACLVSNGDAHLAMYLANPTPPTIDSQGGEFPSHGELHLTSAYGTDYTLDENVPCGGFMFSPDNLWAIYEVKAPDTTFSLKFASISLPALPQPNVTMVEPRGLDDEFPIQALVQPSPSLRYYVVGVLPKNVKNEFSLHIVQADIAQDVLDFGPGSDMYPSFVAPGDELIFINSTSSTTAGQPSHQNLYVVNIPAAINGTKPSLIDSKPNTLQLMGDGHTLIYLRIDGSLMLYDTVGKSFTKIADNVASYSIGPKDRGPIAYIARDRSLHVQPLFQPELLALPASTVDVNSPLILSPDGAHLYYFSHVDVEDGHGLLYHVRLGEPSAPRLVGERVGLFSLSFFESHMIFTDHVSPDGTSADVFIGNLDGSEPKLIAQGAGANEVLQAFPVPVTPAGSGKIHNGPIDLAPLAPPPVLASLLGATRDSTHAMNQTMNGSSPVTGQLGLATHFGEPEATIDTTTVHSGTFEFSDDGYVLAYVSNAQWSDNARNWEGDLKFQSTLVDVGANLPMIDHVSEITPISGRRMFLAAPDNSMQAGIYFLEY